MNDFNRKFKLVMLGMVYGAMCSTPVLADDTEIYVNSISGSSASSTGPNMLFLLDTSGSMNAQVETRPDYDPLTTYVGCFNNARHYIGANTTGDVRDRYCRSTITSPRGAVGDLDQVNISAFVCDTAATALSTVGFATERWAQLRRESDTKWGSVRDNKVTKKVECEADRGVHGDGGANTWATNDGPGWSNSSSDEINWSNRDVDTAYSANYLNYLVSVATITDTRLGVMQKSLTDVINSASGINISLMRFSTTGEGGMVVTPMGPIATTRASFLSELNAMYTENFGGGTPLSETLSEAVMYYQGKAVDYGDSSEELLPSGSDVAKLSHPDSRAPSGGSQYKSPITNECQKNNIVLLSDGAPSGDTDINDSSDRRDNLGLTANCTDNCLDEIAAAIGSNDQSGVVDGDQFISTYTIGLDIDHPLLEATAKASKDATEEGAYYPVDNASALTEAFSKIVRKAQKIEATFSSPAVSVNAFNRSTHLDSLYFTLFKPSLNTRWGGNFKKYKLDFFVDSAGKRLPFIKDANGVDAISDGFFSDASKSFWTDGAADGKKVVVGGAANELVVPGTGSGDRKVYTYTDTYTDDNGVLRPVTASAILKAPMNLVNKANTANITQAMLGITGLPDKITDPATPRIETLLDWASGIDVFDEHGADGPDGSTTDARLEMGAPLHSEPALVQYGETTPGVADLVAFVATTDGYLHAIDVDDGSELFSFIPQELLGDLNTIMDNDEGNKTYGLDGNIVAWVTDNNDDGTVNESDHVYLYITMRRGGKDIYSVDVTDRNNPVLRWVIKGGTGDYAELGQTWSTINVGKVKDGATEKDVLIFGGGYDVDQDTASVRTPDDEGRAIFIADASTGALLWSAGPGGTLSTITEMQYSIPARVQSLDLSGDGYVDRLYAADMGGQIFRFDINNTNGDALSSSITGGRIADLAGAASIDARRFYYPPDAALIAEKGQSPYIALAITSGYRAHPLDQTIQDRIYLLKDNDIYKAPATYKTITEAGSVGVPALYDATLNLVAGNGSEAQNVVAQTTLDNATGWFIKLNEEASSNAWIGEKGLAEALIIEGNIIVTTFIPVVFSGTASCAPQAGTGRVYYLDILDASASFPSDSDVRTERHKQLTKSGIPPSPNVSFPPGGEPTLCIGTECEAANFDLGVRKTYWYEVEK